MRPLSIPLHAPLLAAVAICLLPAMSASGFGIQSHWLVPARWDAGPRMFDLGEVGQFERSLDGGLRYSLQGGSYEAFRDAFTWADAVPALPDFVAAVDGAFATWTTTDPDTGLFTSLRFTADLDTPVDPVITAGVRLGAEIDLFAATQAVHWTTGSDKRQAESYFSDLAVAGGLQLTSGVEASLGTAITGADITLNSNSQALWDLPTFQTVLTHEIGHAIGLADVDVFAGPLGQFIDDNYDAATSDTARDTLTNPFAMLINPFDPSSSVIDGTLRVHTVADADPGFDTPGVAILMESRIATEVVDRLGTLAADDVAARQFLYPVVIPEPATWLLSLATLTWSMASGGRARRH